MLSVYTTIMRGALVRGLIAAAAAVFVLIYAPGFCPAKDLNKITILYTNDTHSRLMEFDKADIGNKIGGIERRAEYFKLVKKENPNTLIVDSGDISQGTPFYNYFKGEAEFGAFVLANYDAATIGNHELDNGIDNFIRQAEKAGLKFVCANLFDSKTLKPLFAPFIIKNIGGVKIAVIGIMGKESWDVVTNKFKKGVLYADEREILRKLCAFIGGSVDLIVLLSHSGYAADVKLAETGPQLDVIIGAHTHTKLDKPLGVKNLSRPLKNTIITQAFENGIYAGRLDIYFNSDRRPVKFDGALSLIGPKLKTDKNSALHKYVRYYLDKIKGEISSKIGESDVEMNNMADMFKALDTPLGSYITDAVREISGTDVFFTNTTTMRDRMPKGPVTVETALKIIPFDNSVTIFKMSGASLLKMMDFIALNFGVNESFQYSGITFTIDLKTQTARDIMINSRPIEKDRVYTIATSSYIAEGNLKGSEMFKEASDRRDTMISLRDMLIEYIAKNKKISAPPAGRIKLIN